MRKAAGHCVASGLAVSLSPDYRVVFFVRGECEVIFWIALFVAQTATAPTQVERGEALFFDASKGCASCHALKGRGTAVGPNLMEVVRLSPAGIATAIRSTATQYVQTVKPKTGDAFPAMPGPKDDATVSAFDLSKNPPELRKFDKADVTMTSGSAWKHPPAERGYTNEQLADLITYIRYTLTGSRKPVDPSEVQ
jgi:mono/diheme cytochrome c family protein